MAGSRTVPPAFSDGLPLSELAKSATKNFLRVLLRCGFSLTHVLLTVIETLRGENEKALRGDATPEQELPDAAHALTVWSSAADYLDEHGHPLPLPATGPHPSFTTLLQSIDPNLDVKAHLRYLLRTGAIRRAGRTYVLVRPLVLLLGFRGPRDYRCLRFLAAALRTAERNSRPASPAPDGTALLERTAENRRVPLRLLPEFDQWLERETMEYLNRIDAYLQSASVQAVADEPVVRAGVGVYRFQDDIDRSASSSNPVEAREARGA